MERVTITSREQFKEIVPQSEVYKLWSEETRQQMLDAIANCSEEQLAAAVEQFWIYETDAVKNAAEIRAYDEVLAKKKGQQELKNRERKEQLLSEQQAQELLDRLQSLK